MLPSLSPAAATTTRSAVLLQGVALSTRPAAAACTPLRQSGAATAVAALDPLSGLQ